MSECIIHPAAVPAHVGIIMDGNGRWAKQRKLPRTSGHKAGVEAARTAILSAIKLQVKFLTLYTFSTENWSRPESEVSYLMGLLRIHLKTEKNFYTKNNIRVLHLGDRNRLSPDLLEAIDEVVNATKNNTAITVVIALNYGGRDELIRAIRKCHAPESVTEENFSAFLDIPDLPDADLIIRTGGEKRLSNFLLWQGPYAELIFDDILWPDYTEETFTGHILEFQKRTRRFGGLKESNDSDSDTDTLSDTSQLHKDEI